MHVTFSVCHQDQAVIQRENEAYRLSHVHCGLPYSPRLRPQRSDPLSRLRTPPRAPNFTIKSDKVAEGGEPTFDVSKSVAAGHVIT